MSDRPDFPMNDPQNPESRGPGQPTLYNDPLHEQIVQILATGVSIKDACSYVRIGESTYYEWIHKYPKFAEDTIRARASARVGAAAVVRRSALGDPERGIPPNPEDAKWLLERTDPATFGRKDTIIALGLSSAQLRMLKQKADEAGVDINHIIEGVIAELENIIPATPLLPSGDNESDDG